MYSVDIVNEAVAAAKIGVHPKDIADQLRVKHGFEQLSYRTVERWIDDYPDGKRPKNQPELEVRHKITSARTLDSGDQILGEGNVDDVKIFIDVTLVPGSAIRIDMLGVQIASERIRYEEFGGVVVERQETFQLTFTIPQYLTRGKPQVQAWAFANGRYHRSAKIHLQITNNNPGTTLKRIKIPSSDDRDNPSNN